MRPVLSVTLLLVSFLLLSGTAMAQAVKPGNPPTTTAKAAKAALPYCDAVLKTQKAALQKSADNDCQSKQACVPCMERSSKTEIHACIVAHPQAATCSARGEDAVEVERTPAAGTKSPADQKATQAAGATTNKNQAPASPTAAQQPFDFYVMRSVCVDKGISLEIFIPGNEARCGNGEETYSYLWEIDGQKGGHQPRQECICAKEVKVSVTKGSTGERVTKVIHPTAACKEGDKMPVKE